MADPPKDFTLELTAWLDGELPPEEARAVERALAQDPALRALEQRLRFAITAVEALPRPEPAHPALRRKVLAAVEAPTWRERLAGWLTPARLAPAGLALAAAATVVVVTRRGTGDEPEGEQLLLAANLDVVEDLDLVGLDSPEDLDVVAALHELEGHP